jgi:transcriptional regulator with XRE-family HTH domain
MMKTKKTKRVQKNIQFPEYSLAERIKYLRTSRNLSQSSLAKGAGISQPTIAQIEAGKKDPSVKTLSQIAKVLDVEVASLFAADEIFVFDLRRLRRKYDHRDKLTPHLYQALGKVIQYARDIGFIG